MRIVNILLSSSSSSSSPPGACSCLGAPGCSLAVRRSWLLLLLLLARWCACLGARHTVVVARAQPVVRTRAAQPARQGGARESRPEAVWASRGRALPLASCCRHHVACCCRSAVLLGGCCWCAAARHCLRRGAAHVY